MAEGISGQLYRQLPPRPSLHRNPPPGPDSDIIPVFSGGLYRTFGASQRPFYERSNLYRSTTNDSSSQTSYTQRTPTERLKIRRRRRLSLWLGATLLVTIGLVVAAVLAALLGRFQPQSDTTLIVTTTVAPVAEIANYQGAIQLNRLNYTTDYSNSSSDAFKALEQQLCQEGIGKSFNLLADGDALKNCSVVSFTQSSEGKVQAVFSLALDRTALQPLVEQEKVSTESNQNLDVANLVESVMTLATQQSQDLTQPLVPFLQASTTNTSTVTVAPVQEILCPEFPNLPTQVQLAGISNTAVLWNCSHPSSTTINSRNGICDFSCPTDLLLEGTINNQVTRLRCSETGTTTGDWVWEVPAYQSGLTCSLPTVAPTIEGSGAVG